MKMIHRLAQSAMVIVMLLSAASCSSMSRQDKNTAIGAGIGAVGGSILTGGGTVGTLGGAAVGGIIGHEMKK